jgi:3-hydroxymyristoyl/3-hydroxydecanoyl-(acyl carrier protein) dehydratase
MPFSVLLETALQPCGWFSAYMGSALCSDDDLSYRNLDGEAVQHMVVTPDIGTLSTRVKATKVSNSGGMLIQEFDFTMTTSSGDLVYSGHTMFGFFSKQALAQQVGVRGAKPKWNSETKPLLPSRSYPVGKYLPKDNILMVDQIIDVDLQGGKEGLGYICGQKKVIASDWFFQAHFYQDPVMPGSLGLETFTQLLKAFALDMWSDHTDLSHSEILFLAPALEEKHAWSYRGQVLPTNDLVTVEVEVTRIDPSSHTIWAKGFLIVDGLVIYEIKKFAIRLI